MKNRGIYFGLEILLLGRLSGHFISILFVRQRWIMFDVSKVDTLFWLFPVLLAASVLPYLHWYVKKEADPSRRMDFLFQEAQGFIVVSAILTIVGMLVLDWFLDWESPFLIAVNTVPALISIIIAYYAGKPY